MDREVALTLLEGKVAATSRPRLTTALLEALLDSYAALDGEGRGPADPAWTPTYDLNAAAAEGWRMKASAVAGDFNFSADGASYRKADVLAHCLEMANQYAAQNHGVMRLNDNDPDDWARLNGEWDGTTVP